MAITFDNTLAGETSNSYCDIDYADDYFSYYSTDSTTSSQWLALDDDHKTGKLVQACRILETLHFTETVDPLSDWHLVYDSRQQSIRSVKTNYGRPQKWNYWQQLQFPRTFDVHMAGDLYIPEPILMAQCEQAGYLLSFDNTIIANSLQGVTIDSINVSGVQLSQHLRPNGSMMCPLAYQMVKPFLIKQNMRLQRA